MFKLHHHQSAAERPRQIHFHLSHNNTDSGLDARVYTFKIENNVVRLCRHSWLTRCPRVSRAGEWPAWDKPAMIESLINRLIDYVTLSLSSSLLKKFGGKITFSG